MRTKVGAIGMVLSSLLTGCVWTHSNQWRLPAVLDILKEVKTEQQLVSRIGPPHLETTFNPGSPYDSYGGNRLSKDSWRRIKYFYPDSLLDTLPIGTRSLIYDFSYPPSAVGGALAAYIDDQGNIVGWSYSKSLISKHHSNPARMDKRDFEK